MALPIAHATAGYLMHRLDRRRTAFGGWQRALTFIAIGNLPDCDFLVGFVLGRPGLVHRGFSHTVLAALAFAILAGALARWWVRDRWLPASLMFGGVYASHLLLDALTIDQRGPTGAQFFWPLSDAYYIAPVTFFTEILIDGGSRLGFIGSILRWETVIVLTRETAIAVVAVALVTLIEPSLFGGEAERTDEAELTSASGEEDLA